MVKAKMKKIKLKVLDWPTNSSDLNPIELVWNTFDKKLMSTPIYHIATPRKRLREESKNLGIELCPSQVDLIPERLGKCLRMKGRHSNVFFFLKKSRRFFLFLNFFLLIKK